MCILSCEVYVVIFYDIDICLLLIILVLIYICFLDKNNFVSKLYVM